MANVALDELIALLTSRERPENPTVEDIRLGFELLGKKFSASDAVQVEGVEANGVPAEWVVAAGTEVERVILYLHGADMSSDRLPLIGAWRSGYREPLLLECW